MPYPLPKVLVAAASCVWLLASAGYAEPSDGSAAAPDGRPTALAIRALSLQQARMYRSAAAEWETFLRQYPEHKHAHKAAFHLGECFSKLELHESVVAVLANYATSFPASSNVPEALKLLATSRKRLAEKGKGTFLDAAASYRDLFNAAPEGKLAPFALYWESQCLFDAGKFEQARGPVEQLLQKCDSAPDDIVQNAWLLRGLIALRVDEKDNARNAFEKVTTKWPEQEFAGAAHYFLGDILNDEGKYAEAAEHFRVASEAKQFKRAAFALLRCGKALEDGGESERAEKVYRSVRQRFPNSEVVGYADQGLKRLEEAAHKSREEPPTSR